MFKLKVGNSIGFASVRLGGWTVMGDPADPIGRCKFFSGRQLQIMGRILYGGAKMYLVSHQLCRFSYLKR